MSDDSGLELYATVTAEVAAGRPIDEVLAQHRLDEAAFEALETRIEGEFSDAMDVAGENVPPFIQRYEVAMRAAHAAARSVGAPLSLAEFARAMAVLEGGRDPTKDFERLGLSPAVVARAASHYAPLLARDPALVLELERLKRGKIPRSG